VVGVALISLAALFLVTSIVLIYLNFRDAGIENAYRNGFYAGALDHYLSNGATC